MDLPRGQPPQLRQRLGEIDGWQNRRQRRQRSEQLAKRLHRLEFVTPQRSIAGPAGVHQPG